MSKAEAHARILAREKDPKHQRSFDPERADRETRTDDINDPKNHDKVGKVDPRWHKDANGHWVGVDID